MRRHLMTLAAIAASVSCVPGAARADMRPLESSGLWSAYGGTGADNQPLCGITTVGADGRRIKIEQFAGDPGLQLTLAKDSWSIPDGTPIDLRFQFGTRSQAIPLRGTGNGHAVHVPLTFDEAVPFMRHLRGGRQILVFFPSGNEPYWSGGLLGTSRAIDAFDDCRTAMAPPAPTTQPFNGPPALGPSATASPAQPSAPTQPFSAPTEPVPAPAATPTPLTAPAGPTKP
jgi:hypothetical protein